MEAGTADRIKQLILAGVRNGEIHRRAAYGLLDALGVPAEQAFDLVHAALED